MASIIKIGSEQQVNLTPMYDNQAPSGLVGLADGGWIATWTSTTEDGWEANVYYQRYDRNGQRVYDTDRQVNSTSQGIQVGGSVVALADGGWVIGWMSWDRSTEPESTRYDIYQQRFDSNGQAIYDADQRVNIYTPDNQQGPALRALPDGGWTVLWSSHSSQLMGSFEQRYDRDGHALYAQDKPSDTAWDVTQLPDGTSLRVWTEGTNSEYDVYMQRYDPNGAAMYPANRLVNKTTPGFQANGGVTVLTNGGWVITWDSLNQDGSSLGVYQQVYDRNGVALFSEDMLVNSTTEGSQRSSMVSALADGGWVVSWTGEGQNGTMEVFQQRFEMNAAPHKIMLSGGSASENAQAGTPIGVLAALDLNSQETFTFSLVNGAGGRFMLGDDGRTIIVANASLLDYEQSPVHTIRLQVKDKAGEVFEQDLTVSVSDVTSENVTGSSSSDVMKGGSGKDTFKGGSGNDLIYSGSGNDTVSGGSGNDTLWGGSGIDTLKGESGYDVFVFDTPPSTSRNRDKIADFNPVYDSLWLDNKVFAKLGKSGSVAKPLKISKAYFATDKAKDSNDYLVYNKRTGILSYDADGSGTKLKPIEIAIFSTKPKLTHNDLFII